MNFLGLDLSLTATGVAMPDGENKTLKTTERGVRRLFLIRRRVLELAAGVDLVCMEGYSFQSKFSHAHSLGELGGVIRLGLWEAGIRWVAIPPSNMKKFATGKGNAPKDQVLVAAVTRLVGMEFEDNNQADAAWLRAMAHHRYGDPIVEVPQAHLTALDGVIWPNLREGVRSA